MTGTCLTGISAEQNRGYVTPVKRIWHSDWR